MCLSKLHKEFIALLNSQFNLNAEQKIWVWTSNRKLSSHKITLTTKLCQCWSNTKSILYLTSSRKLSTESIKLVGIKAYSYSLSLWSFSYWPCPWSWKRTFGLSFTWYSFSSSLVLGIKPIYSFGNAPISQLVSFFSIFYSG